MWTKEVNHPKRWKTLNRRDLYCYGKGSIIFTKVVKTLVSTRRIIPCSSYQSAAFILKIIAHTHIHYTHSSMLKHTQHLPSDEPGQGQDGCMEKPCRATNANLNTFPTVFFLVRSFKCTHFSTGFSAAEYSFILAQLHGNSALVKNIEAGGGIPPTSCLHQAQKRLCWVKGAEGADRTADVWMEQGSRLILQHRQSKTLKRSDEGTGRSVRLCICGPLQLAWLGVPDHRYRVTKIRGEGSGSQESQRVQRSEPRCTLMLGERCVWFGAGLKYPSPSSCRLHE